MKLYELPRDSGIKIYGLFDMKYKPRTVIFGHIDGAYSYCWIDGKEDEIVHLSATTKLKKYKDGYKVED